MYFPILAGFGLLAVSVISYFWIEFSRMEAATFSPPSFSIKDEVTRADVELGKRIFMVRSGCVECHGEHLSGVAVVEKSGVGSIYGSNLTPFKLKDWSDEEIATAIRYGVGKNRHSLQFMPSDDYEGMSKSDVAAVIAFIRSVPEVREDSHVNSFGPLPMFFSVLGRMPIMFPAFVIDPSRGFVEKPEERPTLEFGRYLANTCTGCHGPEFEGRKIPGGDPGWPESSNIRLGADGFWTQTKFENVLATGISARTGRELRPPMPIRLLMQMNETEVKALWLFLASLK